MLDLNTNLEWIQSIIHSLSIDDSPESPSSKGLDFFKHVLWLAIGSYLVVDVIDIWRLALSLYLPSGLQTRGADIIEVRLGENRQDASLIERCLRGGLLQHPGSMLRTCRLRTARNPSDILGAVSPTLRSFWILEPDAKAYGTQELCPDGNLPWSLMHANFTGSSSVKIEKSVVCQNMLTTLRFQFDFALVDGRAFTHFPQLIEVVFRKLRVSGMMAGLSNPGDAEKWALQSQIQLDRTESLLSNMKSRGGRAEGALSGQSHWDEQARESWSISKPHDWQPRPSNIGSIITKASLSYVEPAHPTVPEEPFLSFLADFGRPGRRRRHLHGSFTPMITEKIKNYNMDAKLVCHQASILQNAINASAKRLDEGYWRNPDTSDLVDLWRQVSTTAATSPGCAPFAMTLFRDAILSHASSIISLRPVEASIEIMHRKIEDLTAWLLAKIETALIVDHVWIDMKDHRHYLDSSFLRMDPPTLSRIYPEVPVASNEPDILVALLLRLRIRKGSDARVSFWEIGTASGDTSYALLNRLPWLHVTAVDAYTATVYESTSISFAHHEDAYGKLSQYVRASRRLEEFPNRTLLLRMDSVAAARSAGTTTETPDLVYIDAGHDFCNVLADVQAWWPQMKSSSGIIAGHDWSWGLGFAEGPAVAMAVVHQLFHEKDPYLLHISPSGIWWIDFLATSDS